MSVPPPSSSFAPPGAGGSSLREFAINLESESGWKRRRAGDDVLRVSALGATLEHDRMLHEPLKLALGMLQIGIVEIGSADAKSRFPILHRLSATAIVPREHGIEGWLWTRGGGSALTIVGDQEKAPNAALLFTKPLGDDHCARSRPRRWRRSRPARRSDRPPSTACCCASPTRPRPRRPSASSASCAR